MTDYELCLRYREGEEAAFDELLCRHRDIVYFHANQFFAAGEERDDMVSAALRGFLKAARDYRADRGSGFRGFVALAVYRELVTAVKTAQRGKHTPLNDAVSVEHPIGDGRVLADVLPDPGGEPCEILIARERFNERIRCIRRAGLTEIERVVLGRVLSGQTRRGCTVSEQGDYKAAEQRSAARSQKARRVIKVALVTITPQKAQRLLDEHNTHNRSVREPRIAQYAADMAAGRWCVNGETIKIASDGTVLDGQHRLWACLDAYQPFRTILVTGLTRESQETMDQGEPRGLHDALKLRGEGDPNVLARAVLIVCLWERDGIPWVASGHRHKPSVGEGLACLERNSEIREALKFAKRAFPSYLVPISMVGALHYLFSAADEAASEEFFSLLGGQVPLAADNPIATLRHTLREDYARTKERRDDPRLHLRTKTAYVVLAWNAWRSGQGLAELRFPEISGLVRQEDGASSEIGREVRDA